VESILVAVLFAMFVRGFVAQPYKIPSGSMKENLLVGDHLVVNKVVYGTDSTRDGAALLPTHHLERGDIVIFRPPHEPETDYIKRVIGLPGEEVTLTYSPKRNGVRVLVDGTPLPESYRTEPGGPVTEEPGARWVVNNTGMATELRQGWAVRHFQVPAGQYLMLGDNRNESSDSRFWPVPTVPASSIRGRAWFIYWSYDVDERAGEPRTLGERLGHYGSIAIHFFSRSRWSRTFQPVG
jgi:signal peptidase I